MLSTSHARRGFTLIEMLVTITIIGLAMSALFGGGSNMLPQARLAGTASDVGDAMVRMRTHALFSKRTVVFRYDLDQQGWSAEYPFEYDDEDHLLGPGSTPAMTPGEAREGMVIESVILPGSEPRDSGVVEIVISPLGRIPPHDVVVLNPEFPEVEIYTVRFPALINTYEVHPGRLETLELTDADFR